jgi:hypothetical protein
VGLSAACDLPRGTLSDEHAWIPQNPLLFTATESHSILVEHYTFGCPRVGDRSLANLFRTHVHFSFRIVYDPVGPRDRCSP